MSAEIAPPENCGQKLPSVQEITLFSKLKVYHMQYNIPNAGTDKLIGKQFILKCHYLISLLLIVWQKLLHYTLQFFLEKIGPYGPELIWHFGT